MTGEATATGAQQDCSGRIVVQPDLTIPGRPEISVGRLHLDGFLGWWAWLVIHIGFMTGFRNRSGAVASWWFAFTRDLRRERTFTSRDVGVVRDVYGEDLTTMVTATNTVGPPAPPDPAGSAGPGKPARGRQ
jgi:NADH:ubiquinone reductase (H+-translocating)